MSTTETLETEPLDPTPGQSAEGRDAPAAVMVARRPVHMSFSAILTVLGGVVGYKSGLWYAEYLAPRQLLPFKEGLVITAFVLIGMLLGFLFASITFRQIAETVPRIEQMPVEDKVFGLLGVILGLIVAVLLSPLVSRVESFGGVLVALVYVFAVGAGVLFTTSIKKELLGMFKGHAPIEADGPPAAQLARLKLLDTNVIIDGRLLDVWHSGFVEGELLLPQFVLEELQKIADSADDLKRARGRRGLDLLNKIREEVDSFRVLLPSEYGSPVDDLDGVDSQLLRVAQNLDAALITNDFNLNRVADVHGIQVLNLNRLALSLKPVVLAGEELTVNVIRPGRDPGQGVAYLDDGTMVVVEDGEPKVGRVVDVVVTSLLQTIQGKMIFAILKEGDHGRNSGR